MRTGAETGAVVLTLEEVAQRRAQLTAVRESVEQELAVLDELGRLLERGAARPGGEPRSPRPAAHGLSAREVTVLRLIAAGCSNREIGQRLHISQNTAANHVRSILTKTASANRAGAVRFAADHALLGEERDY